MRSPASRVQIREIHAISSATGKMRSFVRLDCMTSPSSRLSIFRSSVFVELVQRHEHGARRRVRVEGLRHRELPQGAELLLAVGHVLTAGDAGDVRPGVRLRDAASRRGRRRRRARPPSRRGRGRPGSRCRRVEPTRALGSFVNTTGSSGRLEAGLLRVSAVVEPDREDLRGSRNRRRELGPVERRRVVGDREVTQLGQRGDRRPWGRREGARRSPSRRRRACRRRRGVLYRKGSRSSCASTLTQPAPTRRAPSPQACQRSAARRTAEREAARLGSVDELEAGQPLEQRPHADRRPGGARC